MRIVQGYKGNYLGRTTKELQLRASAWQWKKFNPDDRLVLYCPREDMKIAVDYAVEKEGPWNEIIEIPDPIRYKLNETVRYEIMTIQD